MDLPICAQINTLQCKAAMAHLSLYTNQNKVDIVFIQEPYCYIPADYSVFYVSSHTNPRASLLIRQEITQNYVPLRNFSNPDNVYKTPIHIASCYLHPYDTLEQDLTPTETFITSVKLTNFIWGLDANSKHNIWYSSTTDTRGRILVDFLSLHG